MTQGLGILDLCFIRNSRFLLGILEFLGLKIPPHPQNVKQKTRLKNHHSKINEPPF
ncbi:MAG: hypothetical protein MR769_01435 [Campylobacter sp.]|uniref:hypothetical protein n=1 Tax=Campylobacter sp. TaxID=205 RepID=UPI002AA5F12B|nr:hypothetical protein [Campylobacter sp.]MCI6343339.1 hypothetical protein [Campylobacter sp.]